MLDHTAWIDFKVSVERAELAVLGVHGNRHFTMMGKNNREISRLLCINST